MWGRFLRLAFPLESFRLEKSRPKATLEKSSEFLWKQWQSQSPPSPPPFPPPSHFIDTSEPAMARILTTQYPGPQEPSNARYTPTQQKPHHQTLHGEWHFSNPLCFWLSHHQLQEMELQQNKPSPNPKHRDPNSTSWMAPVE